MSKYLKLFDLTSQYLDYISDISKMILPNVSVCKDADNKIYYHPVIIPEGGGSEEPTLEGAKVLCKYNVTDTTNQTTLLYSTNNFSSMDVDGVEQTVADKYTFDTAGEHTVLFTLAEGVTSIGNNAFDSCKELISVTIGNSVTLIGESAFYNDDLTSVTIPDSVTSIGKYAFAGCKFTSITIPDSVTSISSYAFYSCSSLTNITIGNSVTLIGPHAFEGCSSLKNITCNTTTAPMIGSDTFTYVQRYGTLTVPAGSTGYNAWISTSKYYLGFYNWAKVEA